jgi:polyisoprenyl-teichoic acid--peptidoglycan teichoic acid transferase
MRPFTKRNYRSKMRVVVFLLILLTTVILLAKGISLYFNFSRITGLNISTIAKLIFDSGTNLNSSDSRTNILILGIGGEGHEGPDLTDTMMVLSLDNQQHIMGLISLPRDIWSDTLKDKINSAFHYGEAKKKGSGLTLAKVIVEDTIGIPIHYSILVDFSGFTKIIDLAGGIEVNVSQAFTDTEYPIAGRENENCGGDLTYRCRYETVHFNIGKQHMDGTRALIYVRSRHAEGDEGSDFARGRRQQEVILALKQRLVTFRQIFKLKENLALLKAADQASDMDMTLAELLTVGRKISSIKSGQIKAISIETDFQNPPESDYGGRYVLIPKDDYKSVYEDIKSQLGIK